MLAAGGLKRCLSVFLQNERGNDRMRLSGGGKEALKSIKSFYLCQCLNNEASCLPWRTGLFCIKYMYYSTGGLTSFKFIDDRDPFCPSPLCHHLSPSSFLIYCCLYTPLLFSPYIFSPLSYASPNRSGPSLSL